jgi:hypothetical protein
MQAIKNISKFAREQGVSRQLVQNRIKAGWQFGTLDGVEVMYSPKHFDAIKKPPETEGESLSK